MTKKRTTSTRAAIAAASLAAGAISHADSTLWNLRAAPFSQDWSSTGLITANDDWSGVPSIIGYLGDDPATTTAGIDPQTLLGELSGTFDVIANLTATTSTSGGVGEFELTNPVVGLQGSGTADSPFLKIFLNGTDVFNITVSYLLRDIDGTADNANQQFALQYRLGSTGNFTNLAGGYVADATTGPSLATLETPISVMLPADANGAPNIEIRIMTTNAASNDEWVGVDNISVTAVPEPSAALMAFMGGIAVITRRRRA